MYPMLPITLLTLNQFSSSSKLVTFPSGRVHYITWQHNLALRLPVGELEQYGSARI